MDGSPGGEAKPVEVWRYSGQNIKCEGWFIAFMDNAGCLSVQSDYGDYAYRWNMRGMPTVADGSRLQTMREFVAGQLSRDPHYVLAKFASRSVYNCAKTAENVKRELIELRRARGKFSKEEAAAEWDLVEALLVSSQNVDEWMRETALEEPHFFLSTDYPEQAKAFMDRAWPRLVALVQAELAAEAKRG